MRIYPLIIAVALSSVGAVFAQSSNLLSGIASGLEGVLIIAAIIGIVIGAVLLIIGRNMRAGTYPGERGRRIGGIIIIAIGILALLFGCVSLIGAAALPGLVNAVVNPNNANLSDYQSVVNSCIAVAGISCTKPVLSYTNSTGYIVFSLTQYSSLNWTTASLEFINQSQEGIESSGGFNYAIPYRVVDGGLSSGRSVNVVLPFAPYVRQGAPMLGYLWISYTTPQDSSPVEEQIATIAVS
ncbi:MAG TPA: hypothetical protein VL945_02310 [Candidatus Saccharimonadales bacterium]|nr:hypothetical protein [Candidatus Saccharimonadales bacterium]